MGATGPAFAEASLSSVRSATVIVAGGYENMPVVSNRATHGATVSGQRDMSTKGAKRDAGRRGVVALTRKVTSRLDAYA